MGEIDPFVEYCSGRDRTVRNELVCRHQHLVDAHVRRFGAVGALRDDVRQVALVALIGAVERFDPSHGVRFSTFAEHTISGALKRFARDHSWTVRPPRSLQERYLELIGADSQLLQELGRRPSLAELGARLGCDVDAVLEAIEAGQARRSVDVDGSNEIDGSTTPASGPLGREEPGFERVELAVLASALLARLTPVERQVIELTVLQGKSQDDAARVLGLSQSLVSRTRSRALERLRSQLGVVTTAVRTDAVA